MLCEMSLKRKYKRVVKENGANLISVSNVTNSQSLIDLKSRIFIGNLNTSVITKRHLHCVFEKHGNIKAISMHKGLSTLYLLLFISCSLKNVKGYAFIQYGEEVHASNAVSAEDGKQIAGQVIVFKT
ncbi:hypothetical protein B4U80_07953 [Leptotrombidium deliense]|uniref:RRM domain-containing protein n=1 Tax=Leptotrombidium deliense TaxID=299467 RepID=A0A443SII8_9ACAR|nr:hypothetical protein B4U80_07953 [Leptotrombidium deliense]